MEQKASAAEMRTSLELLAMMGRGDDNPMALSLQARYPFIRDGYGETCAECSVPEAAQIASTVFPELEEEYDAMMQALRDCSIEAVHAAYKYLGGIRGDIEKLYPEVDFSADRRDNEVNHDWHQLMIFVTGICNLKCSYCFSSDIERKEISAEDLRMLFDWAEWENCRVVTPCGGEPLLYKHIDLFLDLIRKKGMETYFASNCTVPLSRFTDERTSVIQLITFHLTSALWQNEEMMGIFEDNLEYARQHGIKIIARANIISENQDVERWFDIIDRHHLKQLNIALTIPSGARDNLYIDPEMFTRYLPVIRKVVRMCRERKVEVSFAKPFPPCLLDKEEAREWLRYENFQPVCNVWEDRGTRNVCISPDMKVTPCLGVEHPSCAFDPAMSWEDLRQGMGHEIMQAMERPLFAHCRECFLYRRRLCQGACLSYKYLH